MLGAALGALGGGGGGGAAGPPKKPKPNNQNAPHVNIVDNGRTMFTGPNGSTGGLGMDMNGFAMSFSGVPGFNLQAMQNMLGGN